jgi:DNA-binding MarR family transcriptional regulator
MRILTNNARVLLAVLEQPELTQREIGEAVGMRYQHVWRALDTLVKREILVKERKNRRTYFSAGPEFDSLDDIKRLKACVSKIN